mmetsp:Transcript_86240/g.136116  ORF Transcript_86240/g.136116 Transcript_86240/m.136116 type:complete len:214 (+) Transcript_86240:68-709(+)|eukprot:CAMPEP_0169087406 /NCGR_PEP_ID=MMETSP1015-20121227/14215_1 /TAXON_ID=342587 /ORGANISM="Karlodinium micrum, Strain CCMP2283" /LENGTH=213 /DNA_ID=CAMNT_0009147635 /DNA_START=67 /DNA_END=708 /DNA_ORIENTATION=-
MPYGTLKKFFQEKEFGFIKPDDGSPDLFAPKRTYQGSDDLLREGSKVSYESEIEDRTNKPKAAKWSVVDAGSVPAVASLAAAAYSLAALPGYGAVPGYGAPLHQAYSPYGMPGLAYPSMPAAIPGYPPLPIGWEQVLDPATGKYYYCNRATAETSWTPPPVAAMPAALPPQPAPVSSAGLPPGWETTADPATGKPYYFNRATGETTWVAPAAP